MTTITIELNKNTTNLIAALLTSHQSNIGGTYDWNEWVYYGRNPRSVPDLGIVRVVEEETGEGDTFIVFEITFEDGTVAHFRKDGYYSSYDGNDWDGEFYQVVARPKSGVEYVRVA